MKPEPVWSSTLPMNVRRPGFGSLARSRRKTATEPDAARAAAEDALSMTYQKVVENLHRFEWQGVGIYPWLRTIALRVALDQLRSNRRELLFEPQDIERELETTPPSRQEAEALERLDLRAARFCAGAFAFSRSSAW